MDLYSATCAALKKITQNFGEAADLTDEAAKHYFQHQIQSRPPEPDTFFLTMDTQRLRFPCQHQVAHFFGQSRLSHRDFFDAIHPDFQAPFMHWALAAYEMANRPENRTLLKPFVQEYRSIFPLRNYRGRYYWVTQIATPFQLDAEGHLLSHLNTYRISIAFDEKGQNAMQAEMFENAFASDEWTRKLLQEFVAHHFTPKEAEILRLYGAGNTQAQQVADSLGSTLHTIYSCNKLIVRKANTLFYPQFTQAQQVARYLQQNAFFG